jgi:hypothetical protein
LLWKYLSSLQMAVWFEAEGRGDDGWQLFRNSDWPTIPNHVKRMTEATQMALVTGDVTLHEQELTEYPWRAAIIARAGFRVKPDPDPAMRTRLAGVLPVPLQVALGLRDDEEG